MKTPPLLLCLAALTTASCAAPALPTMASPQPVQTPPTFTLSCLIFENRAGAKQPVVGTEISIFGVPCSTTVTRRFPPPGINCFTSYSNNTGTQVMSDASGRFVAPDVSGSLVKIKSYRDGYVQPCAAVVDVYHDVSVEIELVATDEAIAADRALALSQSHQCAPKAAPPFAKKPPKAS